MTIQLPSEPQKEKPLPKWAAWTNFQDSYYAYRLIQIFPECLPISEDEFKSLPKQHAVLLLEKDLRQLTNPNCILDTIAEAFTAKLLGELQGRCLSSVTSEAYIYLRTLSRKEPAPFPMPGIAPSPLDDTGNVSGGGFMVISKGGRAWLKSSGLGEALGNDGELLNGYSDIFVTLAASLMASPHLGGRSYDTTSSVMRDISFTPEPKDAWEERMTQLRYLKDLVGV